jgi:hypothetical protein
LHGIEIKVEIAGIYVQLIPKVLKLLVLFTVYLVQIWVLNAAGNENNLITLFPSISCDKKEMLLVISSLR